MPAGACRGDATYRAHRVDPAVRVACLPSETRHMGRHQGLRRNRVSVSIFLNECHSLKSGRRVRPSKVPNV